MFSKKKDSERIGPSKGLVKWINRLVRFILSPFIHPKIFLFLVFLIIAIILIPWQIYNIAPTSIPAWYKQVIISAYEKVAPWKENMVKKYNDMREDPVQKAAEAHNKDQRDIVEYNVESTIRHNTFSSSEPVYQPETNQENVQPNVTAEEAPAPVAATSADTTESVENEVYFKRNDNLKLIYLDKPEKISGRFTVINANEALIGTREIFLYGIYTAVNVNSQAAAYLVENYDGKQVDCYIGAYTENNQATAICFDNNENINLELIKQGFAMNVSLY